ncbi:hypothetical protein SAMD00019534_122740 [Acytostelium subglobosum LB1]|uniref:hypothetical protein n=1 Tax=Acytostelium subglobosum LB1 TaxID=1410327 RepID=UPI0006450182|nr:hypothetical protein SAMD00019534_122740 [Acytostelium subglobosum LB1]GAM29098.1 hypothetical protein SAMD00019534_122740 [Acytostelium subglobosum LB1]|eukprot:XP_012747943.1 hypothetical protein SAMD00019534_122740 [Acytostelium subglobosum LB1]
MLILLLLLSLTLFGYRYYIKMLELNRPTYTMETLPPFEQEIMSETEAFEFMSSSYFKSHKRRLAVSMPFPVFQTERTLDALRLWDETGRKPCIPDSLLVPEDFLPDLLMYTNRDGPNEELESAVTEVFSKSSYQKCFGKLVFVYADLTPELDAYPNGPGAQFGKFFTLDIVNDYDYVLQVEPDVVPIRSKWVDEFVRITYMTEMTNRRPFMAVGSTYRPRDDRYMDFLEKIHVNGNAIWSTSERFRLFLRRVEKEYNGLRFYDWQIFKFLYDMRHWNINEAHYGEFMFSDYIQNFSWWPYDEEEIRVNYPRTYLIHGNKHTL